jgi:LAO/AO transport system kinase
VANEGKGIAELGAAIAKYEAYLAQDNRLLKKIAHHWETRLVEMLRDAVLGRIVKARVSDGEIALYAVEVANHKRDPYALVEEIVSGVVKA